MLLKNKKTGEIGTVKVEYQKFYVTTHRIYPYNTLAELFEEWEDMPEEPKVFWYIENNGDIDKETYDGEEYEEKMIEIGNYFETREEAELAVRKLKAWKRLRDKGFRFTGFSNESIGYEIKELSGDFALDLDLLFNGGENG